MSTRFNLNVSALVLKKKTPRKASFYSCSPEKLVRLYKLNVEPSPDSKMIKLLSFDNLFPPLRHSRENWSANDDGYHVFPPK